MRGATDICRIQQAYNDSELLSVQFDNKAWAFVPKNRPIGRQFWFKLWSRNGSYLQDRLVLQDGYGVTVTLAGAYAGQGRFQYIHPYTGGFAYVSCEPTNIDKVYRVADPEIADKLYKLFFGDEHSEA